MCEFLTAVLTNITSNLSEIIVALIIGYFAYSANKKANEISEGQLNQSKWEKEEQIFSIYAVGVMELMYNPYTKRRTDEYANILQKAHTSFTKAYSLALFYQANDLAEKIRLDAFNVGIMEQYCRNPDRFYEQQIGKKYGAIILLHADREITSKYLKPDFVNQFRNVIGAQ